jgi:hypothetical protein
MANTGADIGVVAPGLNNAYCVSVKPNITTNTLTRKYIGGGSKTRSTGREYRITVTGDVSTDGIGTYIHNSDSLGSVAIGAITFADCVTESFKLEASEGNPLQFTVTLIGKSAGTATEAGISTPSAESTFFLMSDSTSCTGGESGGTDITVTAFSIEGTRNVTPVYGAGSLDPTDFSSGAWEYTASVSYNDLSNVADVANGTGIEFAAAFEAIASDGETSLGVYSCGASGGVAREVSGSVDAESPINVPVTYVCEGVSI